MPDHDCVIATSRLTREEVELGGIELDIRLFHLSPII